MNEFENQLYGALAAMAEREKKEAKALHPFADFPGRDKSTDCSAGTPARDDSGLTTTPSSSSTRKPAHSLQITTFPAN